MSRQTRSLEEEQFLQGRKKAMALLNHNDRTKWELRDRLKRAGFSEKIIEDAVAYVESYHYIDDARYAERFAEIYHESRSIQRIRQDLQKRHVSEEHIEAALAQINWDDSQALKKELKKMLRAAGAEQPEAISFEERQKIAGKLYRKGFQAEAIYRVLGESLSE